MMRLKHTLYVILAASLLSCNTAEEGGAISLYTVAKGDFQSTLRLEGTVESESSVTVSCINNPDGAVIFLVEDGTIVEAGDTICIIEDVNFENNYLTALTTLETEEVLLNKTRADLALKLATLQAQVANNEADTKIAQLDSAQIEFLSPNQRRIKELELEMAAIKKENLTKKLTSLETINNAQIRRSEIWVQRAVDQVKTYKDRLNSLTLTAPRAGMAIRADYTAADEPRPLREGDAVWGRMPLVTFPDMNKMRVKIMASERDYKVISVGDSIVYTFDAMPDNMAWGRIIRKSPVGQQVSRGSAVKLFEIEASVDSMLTVPRPGLSADCLVLMKSVKDTIAVPQIAVFDEDSIKTVYVQQGRSFEMRQVKTGLSSADRVIITGGLAAGETVSLVHPDDARIKGRKLLPEAIVTEQDSIETTI